MRQAGQFSAQQRQDQNMFFSDIQNLGYLF